MLNEINLYQMKHNLQKVTGSISASIKVSLFFALVLETLSSLQIIHIIIKIIFNRAEGSSHNFVTLLKYITSLGGSLDVITSFSSNSSLMKLLWICFAPYFLLHLIIFFVLIISTFKQRYFDKGIFTKWIATLYLVHSRLLFFSFQSFFLNLIRSYIDCNNNQDQEPFFCEDVWMAFTILFVCVNLLVALVLEIFMYQINKNGNKYATNGNLFHGLIFLHKNCILIIYFFIWNYDDMATICSVLCFLLVIVYFYVLFTKIPFYQPQVLKVSIMMTGLIFCFTLIVTLRAFIIDMAIVEVLSLVLPLLSLPLSVSLTEFLFRTILEGKMNTPEKAILFAILLKKQTFGTLLANALSRMIPRAELISKGILINHQIVVSGLTEGMNAIKVQKEVFQCIFKILSNILEKNQKSAVLLLFMAKIALKKLDNLPMAMSLSMKARALCRTIPLKNSFENFNSLLNTFYSKIFISNSDNVDILKYFEYRKTAIDIQSQIKDQVEIHLNLWQQIKKKEIDLRQFIDQTDKIEKISVEIEKSYHEKLAEFIKCFRPALLTYELYLEIVQNYPGRAKKFLNKFQMVTDNYNSKKFDTFGKDIAVIITSLDKGKADIIIDASESIQNIFQMKKRQIIGQSIGCLFPSLFAKHHLQRIRQYIESNIDGANNTYKSYGRTQSDDIFEIEVHFQFYINSESEVKLMSVFRKQPNSNSVMILGQRGNIIDCSENLRKTLNIDVANLKFTKMEDFVAEFGSINKAFNIACAQKHPVESLFSEILSKNYGTYFPDEQYSPIQIDFQSQNILLGEDDERSVIETPYVQEKKNNGEISPTNSISSESGPKFIATQSPKYLQQTKTIPLKDSSMSQEKTKEIYEKMIKGNKLLFVTQQKGILKSLEIEFNVQIEPYVVDGEVYKLLKLSNEELRLDNIPVNNIEEYNKLTTEGSPISRKRRCGLIAASKPQMKEDLNTTDEHLMLRTISQLTPMYQKVMIKPVSTPKNRSTHIICQASEPSAVLKRLPSDKKMNVKKNLGGKNSISGSISSANIARAFNELMNVLSSQKSYPSTKKALGAIYLIIILLVSLAVINIIISISSVLTIRGDINIIGLANSRLTCTLRAYQFLTRIYLRVTGRIPVVSTFSYTSLITSINDEKNNMLELNRQLSNKISTMSGEDYHKLMYNDEVTLWELSSNGTSLIEITNTFLATNILANKLNIWKDYRTQPRAAENRTEAIFALNNTVNDYLISSEKIIFQIQNILQSTIKDDLINFKILIGFASVTGLFVIVFLVVLAWKIMNSQFRLFWAMLTIEENSIDQRIGQIESIKFMLQEDIESKEVISEIVDFFKSQQAKSQFVKQKAQGFIRTKYTKYNSKGVVVSLIKTITTSAIVILLIICCFLIAYVQSTHDFEYLYQISVQLSVTTRAQYQMSLLPANFYLTVMFLNVKNMLMRNQNSYEQLQENFRVVKNINQDLYQVFVKDGVFLDPVVDEILNSKVCEYLPDSNKPFCYQSMKDQKIGLLTINSNFVLITMYYMDLFFKNPTFEAAEKVLTPYGALARPNLETLEATFKFLNKHIEETADIKVSEFIQNKVIISIVNIILILFYIFLSHFGTFKNFGRIDKSRGKIIKLIPYDMLRDNKAFRYYLLKDFNEANRLLKD